MGRHNDSDKITKNHASLMCQTPTTQPITGIADTGASGHYLRTNDPHQIDGTPKPPIMVGLPNGASLHSTNKNCTLALPQLPKGARDAHILPGLTHSSLVSIGKLCDAGCTASFNQQKVIVHKKGNTLLEGKRDFRTGLWRFPLSNNKTTTNTVGPSPNHQTNSAYQTTTISTLIDFLHATAFSPVKSTWIKAIQRGFFRSWPGLTTTAVTKHFPQSEATTKGHMDQIQKNTRSTKTKNIHCPTSKQEEENDPKQEIDNASHQHFFATVTGTGKIYTDQTRRFPVTSSRGNQYVLVLYDYDTNAILTEPLKNRTGGKILRAYQHLHSYLTS